MALLRRRIEKRDDAQRGALARRNLGDRAVGPLSRLRAEVDRVFERVWQDLHRDPWSALTRMPDSFRELTSWPAMDVAEDEKTYSIRMDVPGLEAKDLEVEVSGNQLTVRGQRNDEFKDENKGVYRRERYSGSFARSVTLPPHVDPSKMEAKYEKGTLTLTVPRIPGQGPRRVQVKA